MSKPNPLPWRADGPDIFDATNEWVAVGAFNGDLAAREIVRAVNAHAALLAACKAILAETDPYENCFCYVPPKGREPLKCGLCQARAAIALAKPEGK